MNKEELMQILPHRDNMLLVEEGYVEDEKFRNLVGLLIKSEPNMYIK